MSEDRTRWVVGCMTGTSLDGLDAALARITGSGLDMQVHFHGLVSRPLGPLADQLRHFAEGKPAAPIDYLRAARQLGELHADAVEELCEKYLTTAASTTSHDRKGVVPASGAPEGTRSLTVAARSDKIPKLDFIVAHGQTIWHAPDEKLSWQLMDPWPLVRRLGAPVCYDLRQADLIAGGEGAPITPMADWVMYRAPGRERIVVNLGGVCNITRIGAMPAATKGRDVAPCNIIIDGAVQRLFPLMRFDADGRIARSGRVVQALREAVVIDIHEAIKASASLGREQFPVALLDQWIAIARKYERSEDIIASYVAAVADLIVFALAAMKAPLMDVVLAGGGARNQALADAIASHELAAYRCMRSDELGIPCEAREALAFAVLGALSLDGVPITLPQVTGADDPGRAGAWAHP